MKKGVLRNPTKVQARAILNVIAPGLVQFGDAKRYDPVAAGALCNQCPLQGHTVVPPSGPKSAKLAVVGEAPGFNEEREGVPFIGRSGKMLDSLLEHNGVKRREVWISNTTLCKPPELRIGAETVTDAKKLRKAMACCKPRLARELESLKNLKVVIPLGAPAVKSIIGRQNLSIQKARGFVWTGQDPPVGKKRPKNLPLVGSKVMICPSVHPAFVLRAPAWRPVIFTDFERAVRALNGQLRIPIGKFHLAPTLSQLRTLLPKLGRTVALDVETTKESPTVASLLCVGVSDGKTAIVIPWASASDIGQPWYGDQQGAVLVLIKRMLRGRIVVTQNGPSFDHIVCARYGFDIMKEAASWEDTLVASHAYAAHMPMRLDHIVSMYIDAIPWKITAKKPAKTTDDKGAWNPDKLSNEELWKYNGIDCIYTQRTWPKMQDDLKPERPVYEIDKRVSVMCRSMTEVGFAVDVERHEAVRRELQGRENAYLGRLRDIVGFRVVPTKLDHLRKALFKVLHAPVLFRSIHSNTASTGAETLQALAQMNTAGGRFARTLLMWRAAWKLRSTYVDGIEIGKDKRVHAGWKLGPVSGRLACRDPNLQNLKRGSTIRSMYWARNGFVLVSSDAKQLEMRMAAYVSQDPKFIESCESIDIHTANMVILFGESALNELEEERKRLRDMAKESGFAIVYLAQPQTVHANMVAKGFRIDLRTVEVCLDRMRKMYSRYYEFQGELLAQVQRDGYLRQNLSGRRSWFGHEPSPTEVGNRPIQGGAADVLNKVAPEVEDELAKRIPRARLVAQVHDQVIVEAPEGKAVEVAQLLRKVGEQPFRIHNRDVVFPVDIHIARRWSELSDKKTEWKEAA